MRHITTFEYIRLLVTHNSKIAFLKFQMAFYQLFDFFEESWWVYVSPKKSKGDYHLFKLGQNTTQSDATGLSMIVIVAQLLKMLQYTEEQQHAIMYVFYPPAYHRFLVERELLDQMTIVHAINNREDLMDAGDLLGFRFREKYKILYGFTALIEYENKGNES